MANTTAGLSPVYSPISVNKKPINLQFSASFYKPPLLPSCKQNPISTLHRSRTARIIEVVAPKQRNWSFSVFGSLTDDSRLNPEEESKDSAEGQVGSIDIKLPRRSLLVEFSCNSCGERTKRLINRHAYERGLVFVQCAGCLRHHKLVDNLGLIVEYDFRETSKDLGAGAGAGGRLIGVGAGGEAGAGGGDAGAGGGEAGAGGGEVGAGVGGGEAGAGGSDTGGGETVGAETGGLCGGCRGGVAGLLTGATFGAGDEVGVAAGGGVTGAVVVGGGAAVVGGGAVVVGGGAAVVGGGAVVVGGGAVVVEVAGEAAGPCALTLKGEMRYETKRRDQMIKFESIVL